jgi:L-threonylcarbamoyladenylate synthase
MTIPDFAANVDAAVSTLRSGNLIALPTDTLYALAAAANDAPAVRRVFEIKGREAAKPLPLFVADLAMAERTGVFNERARRLIERFWPGALTIVVSKQPGFESDALVGGDTVALRAPDHDLALAVIRALDVPITGTSANLSGGADPDTATEVKRQIGDKVDLIIDGGVCAVGVSSTIVDCTGDDLRILRHGAISEADIQAALTTERRPAS